MKTSKPFGEQVAELRESAKMSQEEAAAELKRRGVSVSMRSLAGYERGENTPPAVKQQSILRELSNIAGKAGGSEETQTNTVGNAGIIFIDADTGKEFFVVEFPPYLRVINPYEVVLRPRGGGGPLTDVDDLEHDKVG